MLHHDALAHPDAETPPPACTGELVAHRLVMPWPMKLFRCSACGAGVVIVKDQVHWRNHEEPDPDIKPKMVRVPSNPLLDAEIDAEFEGHEYQEWLKEWLKPKGST